MVDFGLLVVASLLRAPLVVGAIVDLTARDDLVLPRLAVLVETLPLDEVLIAPLLFENGHLPQPLSALVELWLLV